MLISTISIAEYCIGGNLQELPLKNLQINERKIIPNDTKFFAQADCEKTVEFYLSSDKESRKIYNTIKERGNPKFQFIDLQTPYNESFGILDL